AATEWLARQGIVHFGIDSMRPGPMGVVNSLVHKACLELDITHIESLCNLEALIGQGEFRFIGLPLKWRGRPRSADPPRGGVGGEGAGGGGGGGGRVSPAVFARGWGAGTPAVIAFKARCRAAAHWTDRTTGAAGQALVRPSIAACPPRGSEDRSAWVERTCDW